MDAGAEVDRMTKTRTSRTTDSDIERYIADVGYNDLRHTIQSVIHNLRKGKHNAV